ncbi:MAG TPA: DnaB-like helicase N-terminal domain-containing protein, partial [Alphaproteobacteria bacterium]|nr:DnaB-like helicase N-terminal domain-containing protein [Alphaproteobacteria bacterium]
MSQELMQKGIPYAELADDSLSKTYRSLPHNAEAEQGLLGALLVDNRGLEKVGDFLKPAHFFTPVHGRIYEAIVTLIDR